MNEIETMRHGVTVIVNGSSREGILDAVTRALDGAATEMLLRKYAPVWDEVTICSEVRKIQENRLTAPSTTTTLTAITVDMLGAREKRDTP